MTENPHKTDATSGTEIPVAMNDNRGASIGFIILTLLVSFVAYWMFAQGRQALTTERLPVTTSTFRIEGFRSELWQLPDEPLVGFVEIPAGQFLMGSAPSVDRQAYENERWSDTVRQGSVNLPRYLIGRYEVTVAQYRVFVDQTGRAVLPETLAAEDNHPVTNITWTDALAYSRWLEQQLLVSDQTPAEIRDLLTAGWQVTLPSEAEWEKAARGTDGDIYPWGNSLVQDQANYNGSATRAVGSYRCSNCNFGLADMSGNVWS